MALFDACVDLNPHQIDVSVFALRNHLIAIVQPIDPVRSKSKRT